MMKVLLVLFGAYHFIRKANNIFHCLVKPSLFNEQRKKERSWLFKEQGENENEKGFWILVWPVGTIMPQRTRPQIQGETIIYCFRILILDLCEWGLY